MDFSLNKEQEKMKKDAREFLERECPESFVRDMEEDEKGFSPELWRKLADKGWLACQAQGKTFLYSATVPRAEASANIAEDVKRRVFGDSCAELVRTLLDHSSISSGEIAELKHMIDQYAEGES